VRNFRKFDVVWKVWVNYWVVNLTCILSYVKMFENNISHCEESVLIIRCYIFSD